jgi:gamma-glutamylcyclotransferase (GGCT)/AIG2-like uncharacterized protein YtfP
VAISKLATKDELSIAIAKLATKDDLEKSIGDLAIAVKIGFDEVHGKFAGVNKRLDEVVEQLDNLEEKSATKTELYETETRLGEKIDKLDGKVETIYNYMGKAEARALNIDNVIFLDHGPRIRVIEKTVGV